MRPEDEAEAFEEARRLLSALLFVKFDPQHSTSLQRHMRVESLRRHEQLRKQAFVLYALLHILEDPNEVEPRDREMASNLIEELIVIAEVKAAQLDRASSNTNRARHAADAAHKEHREKKALVIEAYKNGNFPSKDKAAEILSPRFNLAVRTVREYLKNI